MSRFLLRCTITAACVVALSPLAALAQSDAVTTAVVVDRSLPTMMAPTVPATTIPAPDAMTPTVTSPVVAARAFAPQAPARSINDDVSSVVRRRASFGRPAVLMITGGALLLTGLIVDGDASTVLIIAGAGIGGYGLYLHLQSPNARLRR